MKESACIAVKSVLKKAERETEKRDIGIIEIAKERGFIDKSGNVTQEGFSPRTNSKFFSNCK
tara:strand:- start:555 stop:740 length:186 start_codon:yes stop_codon:yes gene_type:complete